MPSHPDHRRPNRHGLDSLLQQAAAACGSRRCEDAIALLEEALRLQPANCELCYRLGLCHGGGCCRHSLTNQDVAIVYLRQALGLIGASGEPAARAAVLDGLGDTYLHSTAAPATARLEAAIESYQAASAIHQSRGELSEWARAEYNLGNAWCELPEKQYPTKWQRAIEHYEGAVGVRTRDRNPVGYAATLENLGTAYRQLPTGDKRANVFKAIHCYRCALRVYSARGYDRQYAAVENNLGNAWLSLPFADEKAGDRNARRALRHFERALRVRTRSGHPADYAVTQYNRGFAFLRLAATDGEARMRADACFQEAYECFLTCGQNDHAERARAGAGSARDQAILPT